MICSLIAIKLFAGLAARLLSARGALLATAFFALHPFLFWASLEIRVYSLVILLSIVLVRLFPEAFPAEGTAPGLAHGKVWFLVAMIVALYVNYYLGFLIAGLLASLIVGRRWVDAARCLMLMFVAGVAFLPLAVGLRTEFLAKAGGYQEERSIVEGVRILWHHVLTFMLPTEVFPDHEPSIFSAVRLWVMRAAVAALAVLVFKYRRALTANTITLAVIAVTTGVLMLAAYFFVGAQYIAIRHASVLFVPGVIGTALVLSDALKGASERVLGPLIATGGILVLIAVSYSMITLYPNATKRGDWARVADFIMQNETPGEPIIVFTTFDAVTLPYYYNGVNRILPDERFFDFQVLEEAPGSSDSLVRETAFVISEIPPEADRVWLAVNEKCLVTRACVPLQNYIATHYTIEIEQDFYLEKVYLLKKKQ